MSWTVKGSLAAAIFAGAGLLAGAAWAEGTAKKSPIPKVATQCLSCHSATGRPLLADVPIIAGQQSEYLFNALNHYKQGTRTGGQALVMQEMVKDLTEEDFKTLATWFGGQK